MTTTLLPADEIAKLRVMKGLAYMLAVMITLDRYHPGAAFRPEQVALVAGLDARTVAKQLQDLSTLDRVILTKGGFTLTQGGRALFLAPATEEALALSPVNQALEAQALDENAKLTNRTEDAGNTHSVRALLKKKEEVDSFSFLKTDSTSSSETQSAQGLCVDGEWPTVRAILEATPDLFGEPGVLAHGLDLDAITPWMALAWIAHCWDQWVEGGKHGNLYAPSGVVHNRLKSGQKPRPIYYNNGWDILPDAFLESLGLRTYACSSCGDVFTKRADLEAHESLLFICEHGCEVRFHTKLEVEQHYVSMHSRKNDIEIKPLVAEHKFSIAWASVKDQLRIEMPRASFEAWVMSTQAVDFDGKNFTVGTCNTYTCDWLESRLAGKCSQLVSEILKIDVTVRFVVADVAAEVEDD